MITFCIILTVAILLRIAYWFITNTLRQHQTNSVSSTVNYENLQEENKKVTHLESGEYVMLIKPCTRNEAAKFFKRFESDFKSCRSFYTFFADNSELLYTYTEGVVVNFKASFANERWRNYISECEIFQRYRQSKDWNMDLVVTFLIVIYKKDFRVLPRDVETALDNVGFSKERGLDWVEERCWIRQPFEKEGEQLCYAIEDPHNFRTVYFRDYTAD